MEDKLLMLVAKNYGYKNWNAVASHFQGRTSIQCCARFKRVRPGRIKGIWTVKEDNKLLKLVERYGKNWGLISNYMCSRTGKQIRDRYLNSLDPKLNKTRFTDEEDKIILKYYLKYGSKWTKIAYYLNGRSGDMVKNRFYSFIRMKCKINRKSNLFRFPRFTALCCFLTKNCCVEEVKIYQ